MGEADDIKPGNWSTGPNLDVEDFARQLGQNLDQSAKRKNNLINQAITTSKITPEIAGLLRAIETSTFGDYESVNSRKIQSVLAFREEFLSVEGNFAYIGAGTDWQFPVALGLTQIDMVDIDYPDIAHYLVDSIKEFDQDPSIKSEEGGVSAIEFKVNLGEGDRKIVLNLIPGDVGSYISRSPLAGVIEVCGPSKSNDGTSPVLPNIAQSLKAGALILNLDSDPNRLRQESGLEVLGKDGITLYTVTDKNRLISVSQQANLRSRFLSRESIIKAAQDSEKKEVI